MIWFILLNIFLSTCFEDNSYFQSSNELAPQPLSCSWQLVFVVLLFLAVLLLFSFLSCHLVFNLSLSRFFSHVWFICCHSKDIKWSSIMASSEIVDSKSCISCCLEWNRDGFSKCFILNCCRNSFLAGLKHDWYHTLDRDTLFCISLSADHLGSHKMEQSPG